jgi:hypothetical protein
VSTTLHTDAVGAGVHTTVTAGNERLGDFGEPGVGKPKIRRWKSTLIAFAG